MNLNPMIMKTDDNIANQGSAGRIQREIDPDKMNEAINDFLFSLEYRKLLNKVIKTGLSNCSKRWRFTMHRPSSVKRS